MSDLLMDDAAQAAAEADYQTPETAVVNVWQRGVPVYGKRIVTKTFRLLMFFAILGLVIGIIRMMSGLGTFTGLNDAYPWGIWKTFNVMVLTALGSGAMSVGIAAWVLYHKRLHTLMRTAVTTGPVSYTHLTLPTTCNLCSSRWSPAQ